jgi:hypothetical protein
MLAPMRRFLVLSAWVGLTGCQTAEEPSLSLGAPSVITDDGTPVKLTARASGTGTVSFQASGGTLGASTVTLTEGVAVAELRCDKRCPTQLEVTATWTTLTQKRTLTLTHPVVIDAGVDAGSVGGSDSGVDAGLALITGAPPLWWFEDAGLEWVPVDDELPTYSCQAWDGGPHPGYTFPDGGPLAVGCSLEPIDFLFIDSTSPTAIDVCGTVELSEPVTAPVYPRGSLTGRFAILNQRPSGGWKLQCLRDPTALTFRFRLEPDAGVVLGLGVRTSHLDPDASVSLYGYFDGTVSTPITQEDAGTPILIGGQRKGGIDFGIGPGKRPGDP